jgi:hypothetical protein
MSGKWQKHIFQSTSRAFSSFNLDMLYWNPDGTRVGSDMPWIEPEDRVDREFIEFVKQYKDQSRPKAKGLLRVYSDKGIAVFHARGEADDF